MPDPARRSGGTTQRQRLVGILLATLPQVSLGLHKDVFREERSDTLAQLPIIILFIVALATMAVMFVHSRFAKSKYERLSKHMQRMQSADKVLIKMLKNCSLQSVNEYHFRGIREKTQTISVGFRDLSTTISGSPGIMNGFKKSDDKTVLSGVSGEFYAGRMSAIMGPSGAGKTTFLNVLCGKTKAGGEWKVTGSVLVNGVEAEITDLKNVTGFVPQDDIVHEGMTVRENIRFSAELRNAKGTSKRRLDRITEDVLQVLQLEPQQNIEVGSRITGTGLSGGQRKRVNIGLELAACPTLLFLDEPTSGLDSTSSLLLCEMLKKMTTLGMTVVMVIHQPRYGLFTLIDDVLLLGKGGRTVYVGPTNHAKEYLEHIGFTMPPNENPADWMMDVLSGQVAIPNHQIPTEKLPEELFARWEIEPFFPEQSRPGTLSRSNTIPGRETSDMDDQEVLKRSVHDEWNKVCSDSGSLGVEGFQKLLECFGCPPADMRVTEELLERAAGTASQGAKKTTITQQQFVKYLLYYRKINTRGTLGSSSRPEFPDDSSEADSDNSVDSEGSTTDDEASEEWNPKPGDLHRTLPGFCTSLKVVMQRNMLQWWRRMTIRMLFLLIIEFAGIFLGVFDAYIFHSAPWSPATFLNVHISIALLISVYSLNCFSRDQPIYWREASHGLNRFAFMCGRMIVDTIDWVIMVFFFVATYYLMVLPTLHFEVYMIPFFLVGFVASGWGYLISCILPPILAPFCAAVLSFMMGGILGLPQRMGELLDGGILEFVASTLCFTRWSVPMDFLAYIYRENVNISHYPEMVQAEFGLYKSNYDKSHWNLPVVASPWWTGLLALLCMGFGLRLACYPALRLVNAGKQV